MRSVKLSTYNIALSNLKRRPFRTYSLIALCAVLAFLLFGGSVLALSLTGGVKSLSRRLGADIMVVPVGYEQSIQGALLQGEPSTFYMSDSWLKTVQSISGVAAASEQIFVASFNAECCSVPVQLIGFEPSSDFIVKSWLSQGGRSELADGEVILGYDVNAKVGSSVSFFGREYRIAAKLEQTGMGFDGSVFMNISTAKKAIMDYTEKGGKFGSSGEGISSIMIRLKPGNSAESVIKDIKKADTKQEIEVIKAQNMISAVSSGLSTLLKLAFLLAGIVWVFSVAVLSIAFSAILNERKKEFGILRSLGATRGKLKEIILAESLVISLTGGAIGIFLAGLLVFSFRTLIGIFLKMPYLQPSIGSIVGIFFVSIIVSVAVGPLSALFSALKIGKEDAYSIIRG